MDNLTRENFPRSTAYSEGMIAIDPAQDNNQMEMRRDIEYVRRGEFSLTAQLITPDKQGAPLIVYVTGSAFRWQNIPQTLPRLCLLANRGFAVASVQYRGTEAAPFPAQMLDVKAAVRFLKIHAPEYGYDSEKIFLMGDSSGGHTALMAGLTAGIPEFEEDLYTEADSSVKGIIDLYGPVDITRMSEEFSLCDHVSPDCPEGFLIGGKNIPEHPELARPTIVSNYITSERKISPVLIFHGNRDEIVPFGQSCVLYDKLRQCGKSAQFYAVEGAHHGGPEFWSSEVLDIEERFIRGNI